MCLDVSFHGADTGHGAWAAVRRNKGKASPVGVVISTPKEQSAAPTPAAAAAAAASRRPATHTTDAHRPSWTRANELTGMQISKVFNLVRR